MVSRDMLLAKLTGGHIHIAHVSSEYSLKMIERAKKDGINVTCEKQLSTILASLMSV